MASAIKRFIVLLVLFVGLALVADRVFSYNDTVSHSSFTENIAQVYNANFDNKLSDEEINWLKQGSVEEDIPIRWMNHFYEPNTNKGIWGFSTSNDWAQSPNLQSVYMGNMKGDQSWQKAIDSYTRGDNKSAFIALGHVLHLTEDATVPAHTRLDAHPEGDPYERWVEHSIGTNIGLDVSPVVIRSLSDAFYQLAVYSNNNFFSKDTLPSKEKLDNFPKFDKNINGITFKCLRGNDGQCLLLAKEGLDGNAYFIDEPVVNSDYFNLLGPKAVSYGAGVIKLFFDEAEKKKQEQKEKSWWDKTKDWFGARTNFLSGSILNALQGSSSGGTDNTPALPRGLAVNQVALNQLTSGQTAQQNNQADNSQKDEESQSDASGIVNLTPQNFPSASSGDAPQPINIVPELPMVLGETTGNGNGNQAATTSEASAKTPVFNPTVLLGAGAHSTSSGQAPSAEETIQQEPESPAASSTPEETASTTEEDLIPPETYATSTPFLVSNSTSSLQIISTSTIAFEFSSSEAPSTGSGQATSTFECSLDNASSTICVSPVEYNNLSDGEHSFEVKAVDQAGNADPTPITFNWTVNAAPPEIFLTLLNYQMTSFDFTVDWNSSSADVISYKIQCRSGEDRTWHDWFATTTPGQKFFRTYGDDTIYYFRGRATDNMGNQSVWQEITAEISRYPVVINEVAWMGTASDYAQDEWIELYNKTNQDIDLTGWTLRAIDGSPDITLATTTILAHSFYLLEKTDDNTVFDIVADQIYKGDLLKNDGEILELRDANGQLIDSTPSGDSWAAGQASSDDGYKTMERVNPYYDIADYYNGVDPDNWLTYDGDDVSVAADGTTPIHGTPKAQNSRYNSGFYNLSFS